MKNRFMEKGFVKNRMIKNRIIKKGMVLLLCLLLGAGGCASKKTGGQDAPGQNASNVTGQDASGQDAVGQDASNEAGQDAPGPETDERQELIARLALYESDDVQWSYEEYYNLYRDLYELRCVPENPIKPEGSWNRTNVVSGLYGSMTIAQVTDAGFFMEGDLGYYSHSGLFTGQAFYITDQFAMAKYGGDGAGEEATAQYVALFLGEEEMKVIATAHGALLGLGANVSIEGTYRRGKPEYTNAGIVEELFTERDLEALSELLSPEDYADFFLFATREGVPTREQVTLSDGREGWCVQCYLPTMGGYEYTLYYTEGGEYSITLGGDDGRSYKTAGFGL